MQTRFNTSTNIIRDSDRIISYIPTHNAIQIVKQIEYDFQNGVRSFNIIGSYGTGKSSFLWAFQNSLLKTNSHFDIKLLPQTKVDIIPIIGEHKSISQYFADYFEIKTTKYKTENIFSEIFNRYHDLGKKNPLLVIIIDEFGKFLEYAINNSPEKELYFIQQLSEFVNNPDHNIILITSVHQNFDAYSFGLNNIQKQEWVKVKGRFREITFNEPIEQLLFLAAEHLKSGQLESKNAISVKNAFRIAKASNAFYINDKFATEIAHKLYPLDLLTAHTLTLALQRYGQNERSLFSFLESTDQTGIKHFDTTNNPFYNLSCLYDYLIYNFYSYISSKYNPDFSSWASIKGSLELIERTFDSNISEYSKILKTIGLLNLFSATGSCLDKDFLINYSQICLGVVDAKLIIDNLINKKIILYRNYSKRFIIFEGTDLDITTALIEAGKKVEEISDIVTLLNRYYQLSPVIAKSHSYLTGTPRLFEFRISDYPISEIPYNETDGYINLIFNENISIEDVQKVSQNEKEAIIYGLYNNANSIKNLLFEIEKTRKVIDENQEDRVAIKELNNILAHQQNLLNHFIISNLYTQKSEIVWIYKGKVIAIPSKKDFNRQISKICSKVYHKSPIFRNELINRHKISSSIHTAKKNFYRALVNNWNLPDLGFENDKFPPEKTIYLTLLKENGIDLYSDSPKNNSSISPKSTFKDLWSYSNDFINSCKHSKRKISEFILPLTRQPFKLKQGLIDLWTGTFLFIKRDEYALFGENGYIPHINDENIELILKNPDKYEIKTFDIEGVKLDIFNSYRIFLNQHSKDKIDNNTFVETIKPFLVFYRSLSEYSRNTRRLKKETVAVRDAIANSKDPEKLFFEDFPLALGFSLDNLLSSEDSLQEYTIKLQESIRELRSSFDNLINRFEEFILNEFIGKSLEFEDYKAILQSRFKHLKKHLCLQHQKTFLQRLDSELNDNKTWLGSIAQVVIGKNLDNITDNEEIVLYDKFKTLIHELDVLTDVSKVNVEKESEKLISIELNSFNEGSKKSIVRIPKSKNEELSNLESNLQAILSGNNSLDVAALTNILNKLLD